MADSVNSGREGIAGEAAAARGGARSLRSRWQRVKAPFAVLNSWRAHLFDRLRLTLLLDNLRLRASSGGLRLRRVMRALCVYLRVEV